VYRNTLFCNTMYFSVLYCIDRVWYNCTALHCTALHCTALHCTALHCTALVHVCNQLFGIYRYCVQCISLHAFSDIVQFCVWYFNVLLTESVSCKTIHLFHKSGFTCNCNSSHLNFSKLHGFYENHYLEVLRTS
jgi:hypothetical protein